MSYEELKKLDDARKSFEKKKASTTSKILCIYHSADLDGICSGAIMRKKFPEAEMLGYDYGQPFPWDKVDQDTHVYMADVSLPKEDMARLDHASKGFTWIDHHKSAIEECESLDLMGVQEVGKAACELCWEHLFSYDLVPLAVYLLGRYDVWDKLDTRVDPFQYGSRFHIRNGVEDDAWIDLLEDDSDIVHSFIEDGRLLYEYQMGENAKYAKARAFETEFHGLKVIACNKMLTNSMLFDTVYEPEKHDAMMVFGLRPDGMWKCSMYTTHDHVDVSMVCKELGGGGHQKAAGFLSDCVPVLPRPRL